jgi:alpha-L-arabinofuranosidase
VGYVPDLPAVPYLDATAALSDAGELTVFLVNRSLDQPLPVALTTPGFVAGKGSAVVVSGPSYDVTNDSAAALTVQPAEAEVTMGNTMALELPPCSLTVVRLGR